MEYLTRLFCPAQRKSVLCYNLVALIATFGDTHWEIPIALALWLPKRHPKYQSKGTMLTQMVKALCAEAETRGISLDGVLFSCDAAYSRVNVLLQQVIWGGMTLITKGSGNLTFIIGKTSRRAKNIKN